MAKLLQKIQFILASAWAPPAALLLVCLAAYAPGIERMGFYWDDWPMNWIAQNLGNPGLAQYFSTNRPVWGVLYQLTTPILGGAPLGWQMAALLGRFLTGLLAWALVKEIWPRQGRAGLAAGLLFVVYPGFMQQHVALLYTHFYLVISFWLGSLLCTVAALRRPTRFRLLSGIGMALGLANLLMMEYFFLLDLLRPILIWILAGEEPLDWKKRILRSLKLWAPYLVLFLGAGIWRAFLFPYTQNNYKLNFIEQLKASPLAAVGGLLSKIIEQNLLVTWDAWRQVINRPVASEVTSVPGGLAGYWVLLAGTAAVAFAALWGQPEEPKPWRSLRQRWGWAALGLGVLSLMLAGWPFWLTDVPFRLEFAYDRFTLPYMLGVSLILAGLVDLLPVGRLLKTVGLAGLVALGVGWQVQVGSSFIQDWQVEQDFFNQLSWRAPALEPGTTVIVNELRIRPTDNSLTGPLNWIYAPGSPQGALKYMLAYPTLRLGSNVLPALEKGLPIYKDYLVGEFKGSTDRALAFYASPGDCLRLLTPADSADSSLPDGVRQTAALSNLAVILAGKPGTGSLIPGILPAPPPGSWCETYEKASLAAQQGDWALVKTLGDSAGNLEKKIHAPSELYPFIEGYAHLGSWQIATQSSLVVLKSDLTLQPVVCALWDKIARATPASPDKDDALKNVGCKQILN